MAIVSLLIRGSVIYRSDKLRIIVSITELNNVLKTYLRPKKYHAKINKKELKTMNESQSGIPVEYLIKSDTPPKPPITNLKGIRKPVRPME